MPEPPGKTYQIRAQHRLSIVDFGVLTIRDGKAALWPAPGYSRETRMLLIQAKRTMDNYINLQLCLCIFCVHCSKARTPVCFSHLFVLIYRPVLLVSSFRLLDGKVGTLFRHWFLWL